MRSDDVRGRDAPHGIKTLQYWRAQTAVSGRVQAGVPAHAHAAVQRHEGDSHKLRTTITQAQLTLKGGILNFGFNSRKISFL